MAGHAATVEHVSTGIPSGKLGMWVFLASEVMFFTGLIAAYIVLRMGHPAWPGPEGHLSVPLGTLNTFILICSSATIVMALAASQEGRTAGTPPHQHFWCGGTRGWLLMTILLGFSFLGIKAIEYSTKFAHEIFPSTNVFWSCYYTMTALHALHVLGGIVLNTVVLGMTGNAQTWLRRGHLLELAGLYWHFVDIVWIFLFPLLYLLS